MYIKRYIHEKGTSKGEINKGRIKRASLGNGEKNGYVNSLSHSTNQTSRLGFA